MVVMRCYISAGGGGVLHEGEKKKREISMVSTGSSRLSLLCPPPIPFPNHLPLHQVKAHLWRMGTRNGHCAAMTGLVNRGKGRGGGSKVGRVVCNKAYR